MTIQDLLHTQYLVVLSIILFFILPLVPNNRIRYYACYVFYVVWVSIMCATLLPLCLVRPKNILNLNVAGRTIRHFTKILGIEWELRNGHLLKKGETCVITANHQSILDIMGMFNIWDTLDRCTVVAKKELLYAFPFGPLAWLSGLIFIDRVNPKSANIKLNTAAHLVKKAKAKLWLFPEGTRNKEGKEILPFKNGAFRVAIELQVPIIPIVYSPYYFIDSKKKTFSKGKIIISVLEPVSTEGLTFNDINELKEKVHKIMSQEYDKLHQKVKAYRKIVY